MSIGIIGYGRFGKFISNYLVKHFQVYVYDKREIKFNSKVIISDLKTVASQEIVIIAVSIRNFEEVLKSVKNFVKSGSLVIDVCSIKEYPVKLMKKYLPQRVAILSTHPLFGPDSVKKGFKGNKIVVYPVRIGKKRYNEIIDFLEGVGLDVVDLDPTKHDQIMAYTQTLLHLVARSFPDEYDGVDVPKTLSYEKFNKLLKLLKNDSVYLFYDMLLYNKYSLEAIKKFYQKLSLLIRSCK